MCTSESKINKKFTITTQDPTASHRISHPSTTRVPSSIIKFTHVLELEMFFFTMPCGYRRFCRKSTKLLF